MDFSNRIVNVKFKFEDSLEDKLNFFVIVEEVFDKMGDFERSISLSLDI